MERRSPTTGEILAFVREKRRAYQDLLRRAADAGWFPNGSRTRIFIDRERHTIMLTVLTWTDGQPTWATVRHTEPLDLRFYPELNRSSLCGHLAV